MGLSPLAEELGLAELAAEVGLSPLAEELGLAELAVATEMHPARLVANHSSEQAP